MAALPLGWATSPPYAQATLPIPHKVGLPPGSPMSADDTSFWCPPGLGPKHSHLMLTSDNLCQISRILTPTSFSLGPTVNIFNKLVCPPAPHPGLGEKLTPV